MSARQVSSRSTAAVDEAAAAHPAPERPQTYLERRRGAWLRQRQQSLHQPRWRVEKATDRFTWLFDGRRPVGLLDAKEFNFELMPGDPSTPPVEPVIPRYYHICTYQGLRVILPWRLRAWPAARTRAEMTWSTDASGATVELREEWVDGSHGTHLGRLIFDPAWGTYVMDMEAVLKARRVLCPQEFCNLLPAGIGDTRPGRAKLQKLLWLDADGVVRFMGKNPLWFNSVGAQDISGRRRILEGGFMGWGVEPDMNPVIEILESDPPAGGATCDNLMDEHLMILTPDGRHCHDGWFHLRVRFRLFSIPQPLAEAISREAKELEFGPMLAWKYQYAPSRGPIGSDLTRAELPGILPGVSGDFSVPVPWDRPFFGQIWTASSHPDADLYYDPEIGHRGRRSIRVTADGGEKRFCPGSGPTFHTEAGRSYLLRAHIRTRGDVRAWVEANEVLFNSWKSIESHPTVKIGPDSDWTPVEASYVARGDEAPFVSIFLVAEGRGMAWFDDLSFCPAD
ncbi:MAG: hypothetical protein HYU36_18475 [Planctomycetes bacterium]|nr:hypothetical protein [Planctomycetota bacterium]